MTAGPSVPNATTVAAPAPEAPPIAAAAAPLAVGVAPVVAGMAAAPAINTSSAAAALAEPSPLLLLTRVDPTLPRELIDRLDRAEVLVTFTVNTAGQVEAPAITSSTDRRLNRNVLSALGEWRYAPPAEPRQHSVRFSFELGG
jgi:TonB family protein